MSDRPHRSDPDFVVLHTLRCIGAAGEQRVANAADMPVEVVLAHLRGLSTQGWVALDPGPFGGWSLTGSGRVVEQEMLQAEMDRTGAGDQVRACYQSFLPLNPTLLQVSGDWQMRRLTSSTHILNDHADPDYDAGVLSRLIRIDDAIQSALDDLTSHCLRFGVHGKRLATALQRSLNGEIEYVTDSLESYHTIWFQLHEDLLSTLGISREDENRG